MHIDDCYQLGFIIKPHGLNGELSVRFDVDDPSKYSKLESVFVQQGQQLVPFFIESIKITPAKVILAFDEVQSVEEAQALKGQSLFLPLDELEETGGSDFYIHEIQDFQLLDQHENTVGRIENAIETGPQLILVLKDDQNREVLVPYNKELFIGLDKEKKTLQVEVADGLLDLYQGGTDED